MGNSPPKNRVYFFRISSSIALQYNILERFSGDVKKIEPHLSLVILGGTGYFLTKQTKKSYFDSSVDELPHALQTIVKHHISINETSFSIILCHSPGKS